MEHVNVGPLSIAYQRAGHGTPLLLLHGAVCDSRVWRVELETFEDEHTVVAWDAPGCGESADPPEDFGMAGFADCLAGLIDALDLGPAHVLGHSWGSTLALELWHRHPATVHTLVLVGAYAGWAGSLPPEEVQRRLRFAMEAADAVESGRWDPTQMPGLFSDAMPIERSLELVTIMSDIRPAGTVSMARALAEADLRDVLPGIDVPTLLVYGSADLRSPVEVGRDLHEAIPASRLAVLPGLGHECYLESSGDFDAAVRPFLRAHTPASEPRSTAEPA